MYAETNRKIEKWTEIIAFAMVKVTPVCWISPKAIISFVLYFATDMGNNAFALPIAMWYKKLMDLN